MHLFVPCAAALAHCEAVAVPFGAAVEAPLAALLALCRLQLDFVPKLGGLASWEFVVPVVQELGRLLLHLMLLSCLGEIGFLLLMCVFHICACPDAHFLWLCSLALGCW